MVKKEECAHNWKALYYRKKLNGGNSQGWFKVKGFVICDNCFKIVQQETKTTEIKQWPKKKDTAKTASKE